MLNRLWMIAGVLLVGCGYGDAGDAAPEAQVDAIPAELSAAELLLANAIAYHDPNGEWNTFRGTLQLEELRPDGAGRAAAVTLDVPAGGMRYETDRDGITLVRSADDSECSASVDGRDPTAEEREQYSLECAQLERSRNYYLFLWGLPMKLRDPGTHIDPEVTSGEFQGEAVDGIRVTYDQDVGSDTWYFFFHPETHALRGYRFYHDEAANDGEYITLEGEQVVGDMRLPAYRKWYVNADDRFLGEDRLVGAAVGGAM